MRRGSRWRSAACRTAPRTQAREAAAGSGLGPSGGTSAQHAPHSAPSVTLMSGWPSTLSGPRCPGRAHGGIPGADVRLPGGRRIDRLMLVEAPGLGFAWRARLEAPGIELRLDLAPAFGGVTPVALSDLAAGHSVRDPPPSPGSTAMPSPSAARWLRKQSCAGHGLAHGGGARLDLLRALESLDPDATPASVPHRRAAAGGARLRLGRRARARAGPLDQMGTQLVPGDHGPGRPARGRPGPASTCSPRGPSARRLQLRVVTRGSRRRERCRGSRRRAGAGAAHPRRCAAAPPSDRMAA